MEEEEEEGQTQIAAKGQKEKNVRIPSAKRIREDDFVEGAIFISNVEDEVSHSLISVQREGANLFRQRKKKAGGGTREDRGRGGLRERGVETAKIRRFQHHSGKRVVNECGEAKHESAYQPQANGNESSPAAVTEILKSDYEKNGSYATCD